MKKTIYLVIPSLFSLFIIVATSFLIPLRTHFRSSETYFTDDISHDIYFFNTSDHQVIEFGELERSGYLVEKMSSLCYTDVRTSRVVLETVDEGEISYINVLHSDTVDYVSSGWPMRSFFGQHNLRSPSKNSSVWIIEKESSSSAINYNSVAIPFGVRFFSMLFNFLFYYAIIVLLLYIQGFARKRYRSHRHCCVFCGYQLLKSQNLCPECGNGNMHPVGSKNSADVE